METARIDEWLMHREWVARLARSLVSDPSTADDLVQEAWIAASSRPREAGELARPWLLRVLRNLATQRHRSESSRRAREERSSLPGTSPSAADLVAKVEIQRLLAEAVLRLEEPFRETVVLRYFEGLTSAEIALRLQAPASTIRWRLMRGLELLRNDLDARHDGSRDRWMSALAPLALPPAPIGNSVPLPHPSSILVTGGALVAKSSWKIAAALLLLVVLGSVAAWLGSAQRGRFGSDKASLDSASGEAPGGNPSRTADMESPGRPGEPRSTIEAAPTLRAERTLVGRVVDPARRPIRGASVRAGNWTRDSGTSTDVEGRFRLVLEPIPEPEDRSDPDWVEMEFARAGLERRVLGLRAEPSRTTYLGEVVLRAGASVSGTVADESGEPVEGVPVFVESLAEVLGGLSVPFRANAQSSVLPSRHLKRATRGATRTGGAFLFEGLPPGPVRVWALDPHALAAHSDVLWVKEGERVECQELRVVRPVPEGSVRGVVRGADGLPVDGADVRFLELGGGAEARADEEGRFTLIVTHSALAGQVDTSPRTILVSDPAKRWGEAAVPGVVPGQAEFRIVLPERRSLTLRARDPSGRPIERFGVNLTTVQGGDLESYRTADRPGGEILLHPPARVFKAIVYAPGFVMKWIREIDPEQLPAEIECTLERSPGVRGLVTADGHPIAGARVSMSPMLAEGSWRTIRAVDAAPRPMLSRVLGTNPLEATTTDAEGRFFVGLMPGQRPGLLRIEADGWAPWLRWSVTEPLEDLAVPLGPGSSIEGTVSVPEGAEASGILVGATCGDERVLVRRTDPQGAYRFDRLAPGSWQVRLLAREKTPDELRTTLMDWGVLSDGPVRECEVVAGETCHHDFPSDALVRPRILGRITVDGAPPSEWGWAAQLLTPAGERRGYCPVLPDGSFELTTSGPGRYFLVVGGATPERTGLCVIDPRDLDAGTSSWSFDLVTGRVSGRKLAKLPEGSQLWLSVLRSGPGGILCTANLAGGGLRIEPSTVPAGPGAVVLMSNDIPFWSPDLAPRLLSIDVPPGGLLEIEVP